MTIEIRRPELQALFLERMKRGAFQNVEDALMQALTCSSVPTKEESARTSEKSRTGADLIAAIQASRYREISIEPARYRLPVRRVIVSTIRHGARETATPEELESKPASEESIVASRRLRVGADGSWGA